MFGFFPTNTINTFGIHCTLWITQHYNTMASNSNNSNMQKVELMDKDHGSVVEKSSFPPDPQAPVIILDSLDTKTEEYEEKEKQKEVDQEAAQEAEAEKGEKEVEKTEAEVEAEAVAGEEKEAEQASKKPRLPISAPTPQRKAESDLNQTNTSRPYLVPSVTIQPLVTSPTVQPPLSPLPELDPYMDIVAVLTAYGM